MCRRVLRRRRMSRPERMDLWRQLWCCLWCRSRFRCYGASFYCRGWPISYGSLRESVDWDDLRLILWGCDRGLDAAGRRCSGFGSPYFNFGLYWQNEANFCLNGRAVVSRSSRKRSFCTLRSVSMAWK